METRLPDKGIYLLSIILLVVSLATVSADNGPVKCICKCNGKIIHAIGYSDSQCASNCGAICGGSTRLAGDCDTRCTDDYCENNDVMDCSSTGESSACKSGCESSCRKACRNNSSTYNLISALQYLLLAIAAVILAGCGLRFITSDEAEQRDEAKKCILFIIMILILLGIAKPLVYEFYRIGGVTDSSAPPVADNTADITGDFRMEFIPLSAGGNYGWLCDNGCTSCNPGDSCGTGTCDDIRNYCCETSDFGSFPVVKGFDYGTCGGLTESGDGYCSICFGGCENVGDGGSCGDETCTADEPYCCHNENGEGSSFCKPKGYDCGCCGGLEKGKSCIRKLTGRVTNNGEESVQSPVTFWVDENCGGTINEDEVHEISPFCREYYTGEYDPVAGIRLAPGESKTVSCSSGGFWPPEDAGVQCWRVGIE